MRRRKGAELGRRSCGGGAAARPPRTATWNVRTQEGDRFEIELPALGRPLRNSLTFVADDGATTVNAL